MPEDLSKLSDEEFLRVVEGPDFTWGRKPERQVLVEALSRLEAAGKWRKDFCESLRRAQRRVRPYGAIGRLTADIIGEVLVGADPPTPTEQGGPHDP